MPTSHWLLVLPLALGLLAIAALSALTADRGRRGTLNPRGRLGVRTQPAVRSDAAFVLANRVAWPVLAGAAAVAAVCAILTVVFVADQALTLVAFAVGLIGSSGLLVQAGTLGDRAARTMPGPATKPGSGAAGCSGCSCGSGGCAGLTRTDTTVAEATGQGPVQTPVQTPAQTPVQTPQ